MSLITIVFQSSFSSIGIPIVSDWNYILEFFVRQMGSTLFLFALVFHSPLSIKPNPYCLWLQLYSRVLCQSNGIPVEPNDTYRVLCPSAGIPVESNDTYRLLCPSSRIPVESDYTDRVLCPSNRIPVESDYTNRVLCPLDGVPSCCVPRVYCD